jgi:hypothetical protein
MTGLVPVIHGLFTMVGATRDAGNKPVDGRDKRSAVRFAGSKAAARSW